MRDTTASILAALLLCGSAHAAVAPTADDLMQLHQRVGRSLDQGYYDAGRRIDVAAYDLAELGRQGREVPAETLDRIAAADAALRERFVAIDRDRAALRERIVKIPPQGDAVLEFEVVSEDGTRPWIGVASITLVVPSGETVDVPVKSLAHGAHRRQYKYHVPPRDATFIYGRPSPTHAMQVGIDLPENVGDGAGELVLVALDDLKAGETPVSIRLNGVEVFSGEPGFIATDWTERRFAVPAGAWAAAVDAGDEAIALAEGLTRVGDEAANFAAEAGQRADEIDELTRDLRAGMTYRPLDVAADFWRHDFVRGVCLSLYSQDEEHHAKWLHSLGVNLVYSYAGRYSPVEQLPELLHWTKQLGLPVFQNPPQLKHTSRESLRLGAADELISELVEFLAKAAGDTGVKLNLAADEPNFRNELGELPEVRAAFLKRLEQRRPALAAAGVTLPNEIGVLPPARGGGDAQVLWMEWQLFRRDFLADHFAQLWEGLASHQVTPFTIIQYHLENEPQLAAFSTMGRALPLISTDIYLDGSYSEAFGLDLLQNANHGTLVFTAGSGYSAHTPRRLARSMITAMVHADGLLEWTDLYLAKYRDPQAFWRSAGDDRGRSILDNWDPTYWQVAQTMYSRMREANAYLGHADSLAQVAVLVSERSLIADGPKTAKSIFDASLSTYSSLIQRGIPTDARLVESSPIEQLSKYAVVFLADARTLTPAEIDTLRAYVRGGGVLIASGGVATHDEWGRPLDASAIDDLLGVAREGVEVLARGEGGEPSLVRRPFGDGAAYHAASEHAMASTPVRRSADGATAPLAALTLELTADSATSPMTLTEKLAGVELQLRRKGEALVVHVVDWSDAGKRDAIAVRLADPGAWRAIDPTRPGHPALTIDGAIVNIPLVHGHGMAVLRPAKAD